MDAGHLAGDVCEQLLMLAFRSNELAGWLHFDAGEPADAMASSDLAMDKALALDDRASIVYLLMRKRNIASDQGDLGRVRVQIVGHPSTSSSATRAHMT